MSPPLLKRSGSHTVHGGNSEHPKRLTALFGIRNFRSRYQGPVIPHKAHPLRNSSPFLKKRIWVDLMKSPLSPLF